MDPELRDEFGLLPPLQEEADDPISQNPDHQTQQEAVGRRPSYIPHPPQVGGQKWWHVPDSAIEALVRREVEATMLPQSTGGRGYPPGRGRSKARQETRAPEQDTLERRKSVRFEGDALDSLLEQSGPAEESNSYPEKKEVDQARRQSVDQDDDDQDPQKRRKWWAVTDDELHAKISEMAQANKGTEFAIGTQCEEKRRGSVSSTSSPRKIAVNIYIVESGDTLTLRVSPDMRLGPPPPPTGNAFTKVFGQGASTKGFDQRRKDFDYRRRVFGTTQTIGWSPEWTNSLKQMIEKVMNISPARQRLHYKNVPISSDDLTLQSFGIQDGDYLQLRLVRQAQDPAVQRGTLVLACSRRKEEVRARQTQDQLASQQPGCGGPSLRGSKMLRNCKAEGDIWMMPRWVSQTNPQLFAPVGIGVDGTGGSKACPEWVTTPIFLGENNELSRVRGAVGIR